MLHKTLHSDYFIVTTAAEINKNTFFSTKIDFRNQCMTTINTQNPLKVIP